MANKFDLWTPIKSEEELFRKATWDLSRKLKESGWEFIIRAIRQEELKQLLSDGPDNFLFHTGACFQSYYVCQSHPYNYARARNGTIVLALLNKEGDKLDEKVTDTGHDKCLIDFHASVEVYNVFGYDWKYLDENKSTLWDCCDYI